MTPLSPFSPTARHDHADPDSSPLQNSVHLSCVKYGLNPPSQFHQAANAGNRQDIDNYIHKDRDLNPVVEL